MYTSQFRFYADLLSIFGSSVFEQIHPYFKIFGFCKLLRVFRINGMIAKANIAVTEKAVANLGKIILYLVLYLHFVACYHLIVAEWSSNRQFMRLREGNEQFPQCIYADDKGVVYNITATNEPAPCDDDITSYWLPGPTFAADAWTRFTPEETDDWEAENEKWETRPKEWWIPLNWANYVDQRVFSSEYDTLFRYTTMMYEAILNIGSNEFGPVNESDMLYLVFTLLFSAILNALIFGDIANLMLVIAKKDSDYQDKLDQANTVMANIHLDAKTADELRAFLQKTSTTRQAQLDFAHFSSMITPALRLRIQNHIAGEKFARNVVISKMLQQESELKAKQDQEQAQTRIENYNKPTQLSDLLIQYILKPKETLPPATDRHQLMELIVSKLSTRYSTPEVVIFN